jgi:hypothetical protein
VRSRNGYVEVTLARNFQDVDAIKSIPGRRWVPERLVWVLPDTQAVLDALKASFGSRLVFPQAPPRNFMPKRSPAAPPAAWPNRTTRNPRGDSGPASGIHAAQSLQPGREVTAGGTKPPQPGRELAAGGGKPPQPGAKSAQPARERTAEGATQPGERMAEGVPQPGDERPAVGAKPPQPRRELAAGGGKPAQPGGERSAEGAQSAQTGRERTPEAEVPDRAAARYAPGVSGWGLQNAPPSPSESQQTPVTSSSSRHTSVKPSEAARTVRPTLGAEQQTVRPAPLQNRSASELASRPGRTRGRI